MRNARETLHVFIEAIMQCKLFDLTLERLRKLRTQDDSQQSRTMQVLQAKATLKELEEALRQALHRTRSKRLRMKLQAVSSTQSVVCK